MREIVCDCCGKKFQLSAINDTYVSIKGNELKVTHFECTHCKNVNVVCITDDTYEVLRKELSFATSIYTRSVLAVNSGKISNKDAVINKGYALYERRKDNLKKYVENMMKTYSGKFTIIPSNNGKVELDYHE